MVGSDKLALGYGALGTVNGGPSSSLAQRSAWYGPLSRPCWALDWPLCRWVWALACSHCREKNSLTAASSQVWHTIKLRCYPW
ncbi:MAG: hypothetical protein JSR71_08500 [Proteobacteria bacterium]|nr:hypothetical protein [Pseudomonadota bacterium]